MSTSQATNNVEDINIDKPTNSTLNSSRTPPVYKIIILGETNVGKSSLFLRYIEDRFKEAMANTIGINNAFKELVIDGNKVHIQLWDTAGQERFRSIVSSFYRESDGFLLVYDVTNKRSFEYISHLLNDLKDHLNPQFTIIIANKIDLISSSSLKEQNEKLKEISKKLKINFELASAKTGENVNLIFEKLCKELYTNKIKTKKIKNTVNIAKTKKRRIRWCY